MTQLIIIPLTYNRIDAHNLRTELYRLIIYCRNTAQLTFWSSRSVLPSISRVQISQSTNEQYSLSICKKTKSYIKNEKQK